MFVVWQQCRAISAEKKVKTFFLQMPKPAAASLTPHCQIVRPKFFGADISALPVSAAPAFIVTLRSSQTLQKLPPFKYFRNAAGFFKLQPCLRRRRRRRLPRLSLLSKSGCCACDRGGGWSSNLLAGQEMKLPAFYWAARWDHVTPTGSGGVSEEQGSLWSLQVALFPHISADFRLARRVASHPVW